MPRRCNGFNRIVTHPTVVNSVLYVQENLANYGTTTAKVFHYPANATHKSYR